MKIAYLHSANMVPGSPRAREDVAEGERQWAELAPACREFGIELVRVVWDDPPVPWTAFEAAVIGPTWDYWDKASAFLKALRRIEAAGVRLFNAASLVEWNLDKGYLRDLDAKGAAIAPTRWADAATPDVIKAAFDHFACDTLVVKPRVGAGAWRLAKVRRGEPLPPANALPPAACLIQPFLERLPEEGEVSAMVYDGRLSHALRKIPAKGDFRVQSLYGAREVEHAPNEAERAAIDAAVAALPERPLYARVDIAPGNDGAPVVMEVELVEPYHYPEQGPGCGQRFADALRAVLAAAPA